jgi:hypothetical protein
MNVLDLCFFRSLQSLTDTRAPASIKELIEGVEEEYHNYDVKKLARSFSTLKYCMAEIMKARGGIHYNIPHNKEHQAVEGKLPMAISITADLLAETKVLMEEGHVEKENKQPRIKQEKQPATSQATSNIHKQPATSQASSNIHKQPATSQASSNIHKQPATSQATI